jgi:membrane fusion protein, multidrug efflux system
MTSNLHTLNPGKSSGTTPLAPVDAQEPAILEIGQPDLAKDRHDPASETDRDAMVSSPVKRRLLKRMLISATALIAVAGSIYEGREYWTTGRFQVSTDDAYVKADNSAIAPKISGYIREVLVADNQAVKAGQALARVDDRDFATALDQAKADVAAAKATIDGKQAALEAQQAVIDAARATIDVDKANATYAEQNDKRYASLATNGYAAVQTAQLAASQITATRATIVRDTAVLAGAEKQIDLLKAELAQAEATLAHDIAVQSQAELNLGYATITAPIDGVVGNRTLRVGQYVQSGTQLMTVVPTQAAYVIANYKETQLTHVHPGQQVDIEVDMFPGKVFYGRVDSLSPASGQEFALLPPDNATGNFTKVVQRIPVKITLDPATATSGYLRPGMSVQPSIDTKAASAQ